MGEGVCTLCWDEIESKRKSCGVGRKLGEYTGDSLFSLIEVCEDSEQWDICDE